MRRTLWQKAKVCKRCGDPVLPITYGFPGAELQNKAEQGEIILGGCCIESSEERDCECAWCHQGYKKVQFEKMKQYNDILDEVFGLLADDIGLNDTKIMGVYGAMARGLSKEEALKKYVLSEKEYDNNIERVLNQ